MILVRVERTYVAKIVKLYAQLYCHIFQDYYHILKSLPVERMNYIQIYFDAVSQVKWTLAECCNFYIILFAVTDLASIPTRLLEADFWGLFVIHAHALTFVLFIL